MKAGKIGNFRSYKVIVKLLSHAQNTKSSDVTGVDVTDVTNVVHTDDSLVHLIDVKGRHSQFGQGVSLHWRALAYLIY